MNNVKVLCGDCVGGRKEQEGKKWECCLGLSGRSGSAKAGAV